MKLKKNDKLHSSKGGSHSARSAWIETGEYNRERIDINVALRKECVD